MRKAVRTADVVATSVVAYPEARSAFARRRRERAVTAVVLRRLQQALDRDWRRISRVRLTDAIVRSAGDLAERYALRGFDAIHLASAASLAARVRRRRCVVLTADRRMRRAVGALGLKTA